MMAEINVRTEELLPARDASRSLGKAIDRLVVWQRREVRDRESQQGSGGLAQR